LLCFYGGVANESGDFASAKAVRKNSRKEERKLERKFQEKFQEKGSVK